MLFSIIIPAFNAEKYLCDSLESVRAQTFTDYEIIIVNDGSTDKTRQIADSFAEKNSQTHVIHQKNEGPLLARRVGLQAASVSMLFSWTRMMLSVLQLCGILPM